MNEELRIVVDIDAEPEPLRTALWDHVNTSATHLDDLEREAQDLLDST